MSPALRDYQLAAVEACEAAAAAGRRRVLVALPTGTGKTVTFAALIERRHGRALVVAHRDELLAQAKEKLVTAGIPEGDVGLVKAGSDENTAPVVLASVQTLARRSRRERLAAAIQEAGPFATVVIDEAHHAPAASYRALLDAVETTGTLTTGWTATPGREGVSKMFGGPPVFTRDLVDMIAQGWLCDLRGRRVGIDFDATSIRRGHGDFVEGDLARALGAADAPGAIVRAWRRWGEERQTLVFTPDVSLAHETAAQFVAAGVMAEALDGTAASDERAVVLERFRTGATTVLVNCALLTEGVDLPHIACVVIGRPTLSPLLYAQMIGRGTRLAPGKQDCIILDLVGASEAHDLANLALGAGASLRRLAGLPLDDGASLLQTALANRKRRRQLEELLGTVEHIVARTIALFGRAAMHWLSVGDDYALGLGDYGYLIVSGGPERWAVYRLMGNDTERLGADLPLDAATALAESWARSTGVLHLADTTAWWRKHRASDKQVAALARLRGVDPAVLAHLTKGEACDLLSASFAAERLAKARRRGLVA